MKLAFYFRKYHKWLALVVGIQALIWCVSGVYMTVVHIDFVHGDHLVKPTEPSDLSQFKQQIKDLPELDGVGRVTSAYLTLFNDRPIYIIENQSETMRVDAISGTTLPAIDENYIRDQALQSYAGNANIEFVKLLASYPRELGGRSSPIWQVQFDD